MKTKMNAHSHSDGEQVVIPLESTVSTAEHAEGLYVLLEKELKVSGTHKDKLITVYAQAYVKMHNQLVNAGVNRGQLLDETEFETQIREDYADLRKSNLDKQ